MKYTIMLVICLWPMIGQTAQRSPTTEEFYSANARYTHSRHYRASVRHRNHGHTDRHVLRSTDHPLRHTLAQGAEFTDKKAPITYAFTTGTSVLDAYEGRKRLIENNSCLNPWRDLDYYLAVDAFATY